MKKSRESTNVEKNELTEQEITANKSLQNLQMPSKVVKVAKVKKNNKSSPIKLASLRTKKEDK